MGTSKKQKKRDGLRYREFVLSPYGVIKIKSLGYMARTVILSDSGKWVTLLRFEWEWADKVAKIKVGLYEAVRDGMIVNVLLEALPDLTLCLDANRSWTRVKADGFARYSQATLF